MGKADKKHHRINHQIKAAKVKIVGSTADGTYSPQQAMQLAQQQAVDLVEINLQGELSICKLIEYSKFLYQLKQKEKEQKRNQKTNELKEIQLSCDISENDVAYRVKNAIEWLKEGNRVKLSLMFKGRQNARVAQGELVMLQFSEQVSEYGTLEAMPSREGKKMFCTIKPKK
jgi:translation initiation factor IF-3